MTEDLWRCDQHSVGVIITRNGDDGTEYLVITREGDGPSGVAPIAGHVYDGHTNPDQAARDEVTEEVGQTIRTLRRVAEGWRDNRCCPDHYLPAGHSGTPGHYWWIYQATVKPGRPLHPRKGETRDARWVTSATLQDLADRTVVYALGEVPEDKWQRNPGLEPVWCHWLTHLRIITLPRFDLERIAVLASRVPVAA